MRVEVRRKYETLEKCGGRESGEVVLPYDVESDGVRGRMLVGESEISGLEECEEEDAEEGNGGGEVRKQHR